MLIYKKLNFFLLLLIIFLIINCESNKSENKNKKKIEIISGACIYNVNWLNHYNHCTIESKSKCTEIKNNWVEFCQNYVEICQNDVEIYEITFYEDKECKEVGYEYPGPCGDYIWYNEPWDYETLGDGECYE